MGDLKLLLYTFSLLFLFSCTEKKRQTEVIVFQAGSLAKPFRELKNAFEKENPQIKVRIEISGSVECARKIADLGKNCDIIASADYKIIEKMLLPKYTDSVRKFATNAMVIAYREHSQLADEINQENWYRILPKSAVFFGRSDENHDPCGYRTILLWQLAESVYQQENFTKQMLAKDRAFIRPKSSELLALLETGAIDYAFLYKSVALQHKLKYINLPKAINLSDFSLSENYKMASIEIQASKNKNIKIHGAPIIFGISVLKASKDKPAVKHFYKFLFSEKGKAIFKANGLPLI